MSQAFIPWRELRWRAVCRWCEPCDFLSQRFRWSKLDNLPASRCLCNKRRLVHVASRSTILQRFQLNVLATVGTYFRKLLLQQPFLRWLEGCEWQTTLRSSDGMRAFERDPIIRIQWCQWTHARCTCASSVMLFDSNEPLSPLHDDMLCERLPPTRRAWCGSSVQAVRATDGRWQRLAFPMALSAPKHHRRLRCQERCNR